jgi:RNA polymerase sigma-70 factor (ECF subfamily)
MSLEINQQSDEDLVNDSRNGDMKAFKVLVERHEGKVAGVVKSMLDDTAEALDVGQEVFIRFYESLDKFKGESSLSTYLVRIAINLSLNEIKRRKKRNSFFSPEETGMNVNSENTDNDLKEAVHYEVNRLDTDLKLVVTLRIIDGYSTEETAHILQLPLGTVLSRLSRAQKKLKSMLTKHFDV